MFRAVKTTSAGAFSIVRGATYPAIFIDNKDRGIYVKGESNQGGPFGVKIDKDGRLLHKNMFYNNIGGWQDNILVTIGEPGTKLFEPAPSAKTVLPDSFKFELIYLGRSNSDIKITYREYKDDIARPAFSQELTYNLSTSNIIRFRNFRLKVLSATNEQIDYVVLED